MSMDKHIDIKSDREEVLRCAILTAYAEDYDEKKTRYYAIEDDTFYIFDDKKPTDRAEGTVFELPFLMSKERIAEFVWLWLQEVSYANRKRWDGDGSNYRGFHVQKNWKQGWNCVCSITPEWIYYGK